ncbi:MAG TPA: pyridoxamine 5'-phosphate oxidase family protein [Candidatus Saccharimonadales bacterium]|nr:pyridoxamine 5'-phosphate oxidase family protein [Candidatus Saccharimonadales bacterium]
MDNDINQRVKEALDRTEIMALATVGDDGSWVSPVKYNYTDTFTLSFVSMPGTKHVTNIQSDNRVSVAIYQYPGPTGGNLGLQITGTAADQEPEKTNGGHRFTITPTDAWLFDSRGGNWEREPVDLDRLQL